MKSKPLTEEALKIARDRLPNRPDVKHILTVACLAYESAKRDMKQELFKLVLNHETRLTAIRKKWEDKVQKAESFHDEVYADLRKAMPELANIEFSMDLVDGTYTPMGGRTNENTDPDLTQFGPMVAELLHRMAHKDDDDSGVEIRHMKQDDDDSPSIKH